MAVSAYVDSQHDLTNKVNSTKAHASNFHDTVRSNSRDVLTPKSVVMRQSLRHRQKII